MATSVHIIAISDEINIIFCVKNFNNIYLFIVILVVITLYTM